MPTSAAQTYGAQRCEPVLRPELGVSLDFNIPASTTISKGTVVGELTATLGTVKAYASGNVDGSQNPKGVMMHTVSSDASGNITIEGEYGQTHKACPIWVAGYFATEDLTGLDANAVTKLGACVVKGDLASGIVRI